MVPARFHKILVYIIIFAFTLALLPTTEGIALGLFLTLGFRVYANNRLQNRPTATPPNKQDIWNRNAARLRQSRHTQTSRFTPEQRKRLDAAYPWAMTFILSATIAVSNYFQFGFLGFSLMLIVIYIGTGIYSVLKIQKT